MVLCFNISQKFNRIIVHVGFGVGPVRGTRITVQDVADKAGIKKMAILDQECSYQDLPSLAKYCVDWRLIGRRFGLPDADIVAVDRNYPLANKSIGMLETWKGRSGVKATYRAFIEALLSCGRTSDAVEACKSIVSSK